MTKRKVFWTGALGAFAPQILRWYSQVTDATVTIDLTNEAWRIAARVLVTALFLAVAGYVALIWDVRNLKEAFLVGLGIPSIILTAGSDLPSVIKALPASAQQVGTLSLRAKTESGEIIPQIRVTATDQMGRSHSSDQGESVLPPGAYTVVVQASGFEPVELRVTLEPGRTSRHEVTMRRKSPAQQFFEGIQEPFKRK